eukprot:5037438-Lingulodinium_polyedra.AAC.1
MRESVVWPKAVVGCGRFHARAARMGDGPRFWDGCLCSQRARVLGPGVPRAVAPVLTPMQGVAARQASSLHSPGH